MNPIQEKIGKRRVKMLDQRNKQSVAVKSAKRRSFLETAPLDEFLNFKNALHLIDDEYWPPNHKTY